MRGFRMKGPASMETERETKERLSEIYVSVCEFSAKTTFSTEYACFKHAIVQ